ncbi:MAG: AAA family ATPase [Pseudomonadota bacterium]
MSASNAEPNAFAPFPDEDDQEYAFDDDSDGYEDEGSAGLAASLGADGGPLDNDLSDYTDDDDDYEAALPPVPEPSETFAFDHEGGVVDEASAIDALGELIGDDALDAGELDEGEEVDEVDFGDDDDDDGALQNYVSPAAAVQVEEPEEDDRIIPRISIHAFCEEHETSEVLERAAVDRRLRKAHVSIQMGDGAVAHYQDTPTPNLIIVETRLRGRQLIAELGELASVCDPSTKVIIIGFENDIALYRELIRQGVSEYLVQPRSPLQLIRLIADLYVDPESAPKGKTYAFIGSRGGVGSSTLAHNVAWSAAEHFDMESVLIDLDLSFGTAALDFEQETSNGLLDALASPERLDDVLLERLLVKCTPNLKLFAAPCTLDRTSDSDDQAYEAVIDTVQGSASAVFIDLPHAWTSWKRRLLIAADTIVVCATPDLASFRNTKNIIEQLKPLRPNDQDPVLVINQSDVPKRPEIPEDQFEESIGLEPKAVIPWDAATFGVAATSAVPVFEAGAKSKAAQSLKTFTADLLGREEKRKKSKSFLSALLGR